MTDTYELTVHTFRVDCTDREQAGKVLEEASEAREAWQVLDAALEAEAIIKRRNPALAEWPCYLDAVPEKLDLADELADCITACCNLAARYGIDLQAAVERVEQKNRERGRY